MQTWRDFTEPVTYFKTSSHYCLVARMAVAKLGCAFRLDYCLNMMQG